jgi:hypothetical protein
VGASLSRYQPVCRADASGLTGQTVRAWRLCTGFRRRPSGRGGVGVNLRYRCWGGTLYASWFDLGNYRRRDYTTHHIADISRIAVKLQTKLSSESPKGNGRLPREKSLPRQSATLINKCGLLRNGPRTGLRLTTRPSNHTAGRGRSVAVISCVAVDRGSSTFRPRHATRL